MKKSATSSQRILTSNDIAKIFDVEPEIEQTSFLLPDPWFLPVDNEVREISAPAISVPQSHIPQLLLPPAELAETAQRNSLNLNKLLAGVDLDKLQLLKARRVARAIGIAQKVNGRDQPLPFLRFQIKTKLQQPQDLCPTALEELYRLLAS